MAKVSANYEVVYIIDPAQGEENTAALVAKFKTCLLYTSIGDGSGNLRRIPVIGDFPPLQHRRTRKEKIAAVPIRTGLHGKIGPSSGRGVLDHGRIEVRKLCLDLVCEEMCIRDSRKGVPRGAGRIPLLLRQSRNGGGAAEAGLVSGL